jgi:cytochrome c553
MRHLAAILALLSLAAATARADDDADAGPQFFESRIRPLLVDRCYACHSAQAKKLKAGLRLDTREAILEGGESGPAVVPGEPGKSRLIDAVRYANVDLQMPPKEKLADAQIADLVAWVKMGAPWGNQAATSVAMVESFNLQKRKAEHWAWKPVAPHPPPPVRNAAWPKDPIDHFILAKLESKNLPPAPDADRRTLLRRVCFDLIGLPPAPREVDDFLNDVSPDALAKVVDRLLASPRFGERWARHWLDLVRYAETMGHEFDFPIPNAWRYRDYVIRALNADVPHDQFVREQIAGDLLEPPRRSPSGDNESVIGTGFWFMGEDVQAPVDVRQHQADLIDNRIDVLGKSILGLTIACARCHDHKFDAISAADYYALYGYVKGGRYTQAAVNQSAIDATAAQLRASKDKIRRAVADQWLANLGDTTPAAQQHKELTPRDGDVELLAGRSDEWRTEGSAFEQAKPGDFIPGDAEKPVAEILTDPATHSALLSKKLEGALRSPCVTLNQRYLHVRAAGRNSRLNVVLENFVVIREPIYGTLKRPIKSDKPAWITIDLNMWQGRQAYLEFADTSVDDPGGTGAAPDGWLTVDHVRFSDHPTPPALTDARPAARDLRTTIESWRDGPITRDGAALLSQSLPSLKIHDPNPIADLINEYRAIEKPIPTPTYALAASDADAGDEKIFIRGNPKNLGPSVPRRFLEALDGAPAKPTGSGRLDLARRLTDPQNPLTARVAVNRVWHHLFGAGLVPSVDNFGRLGEPPTHPELLDHLATRFTTDHWSLKHLIRAIVLSRAYQMSSRAADDSADSADPNNLLLHRANVRRLDAEAIRDHLLAVSGRLDLTAAGGPGIPVHLTPFMEGRGKPAASGPVDGAGRRSIYLEVRRNFLPPILLAFDAPTPFGTMGRRSVSNVPAQALILMNDPFVLDQAKRWATRALADPSATPEQRIRSMYETAFTRPPTPEEIALILNFANSRNGKLDDLTLWTDVAHTLINTKEFIFLN